MNYSEILNKIDHTLLSPQAKWSEVAELCDDAINFGTASVCIPPSYVKRVKEYVGNKMKVCTVIGFPTGYSTTDVKCFEARNAVSNGADEIDMVINIGALKDKKYNEVIDEIKAVKESCNGKLLKVIIETCLLTDEEKVKMCEIVSQSGADYIKTSTGFSTDGATVEDIKLMASNCEPHLKIKAAGGIKSIKDAEDFIAFGAHRLGTSRIVKLLKK
ncbi:MAG TPA: deoxyribose-phosphate aldolase [Clostridia bacterium]|nr:deoxyribose-phosphate aldolase [Clostridia bacterium]